MAKVIKDVCELTEELGFSVKEREQMHQRINERSIGRLLSAIRSNNGLTQSELSKKIGSTQSFVSKVENNLNKQMTINDLARYLAPLGFDVSINISKRKNIVERIKSAYLHLSKLLGKFQELKRDDHEILVAMAKFETEAARNMLSLASLLLDSSQSKMSSVECAHGPKYFIEDEAFDEISDECDLVSN